MNGRRLGRGDMSLCRRGMWLGRGGNGLVMGLLYKKYIILVTFFALHFKLDISSSF